MSGVHGFGPEFKTKKDTEALKRKVMRDFSDDKSKKTVLEKDGETTTNQVNDVRALLEQAEQADSLDARNAGMVINDIVGLDDKGTVDPLDSKYADRVAYSNDMGLNINEFISYMIEGKDLSGDEVTELLISFVQEVLMNPEYGRVTIYSLAQIIDIINEQRLVNSNVNLVELIPQLVNYMLAQNNDNVVSHATFGDIKNIVNKMIEEIIAKRPPVEPEPTEPDPVEPDPVVIDTPEKAMEALEAKIAESNANVPYQSVAANKIEELLLEFKEEASLYIQLQYGCNKDFADMLAAFLANSVQSKYYQEGNTTFKPRTKVEAEFISLLKNIGSLLPTNNELMSNIVKKGQNKDVRITRIDVANSEYGYQFRGTEFIASDNNITFNADGSLNQGMLLKFMLDYFRETIYGGQLNESQLKLLYSELFKAIGGNSDQLVLNEKNKCQGYDVNGNGTYFDDILAKMMEIANTYKPINTDELSDEDIDINDIFATKSSISASYINSHENNYLLSNDPTTRFIMGELVNISNKYNITPNNDSLDLYNVFIKMINDAVGFESGNPPKLSKEALNAYIEKYSIQGLVELIHGTELRDAYFDSTFKINGEIEGFYQAKSGDCWLLSGVMSLNSSPEGREIIKNAIKYDPETGIYSVTFYGGYDDNPAMCQGWCPRESTYEFTKEELYNLMATGMYSKLFQSEDGTCDWDLFLLEVAVKKLREDQLKYNPYLSRAESNDGDHSIYMGSQDELIGYLTGMFVGNTIGGSLEPNYHGTSNVHQKVLELIEQGLIDENGNIQNYAFYFSTSGHAYAITRITADRIYFINPDNSSQEFYIKWSDFLSNGNMNGVTVKYYDSNTGLEAGTLTISQSGFVGPLDETPALNQD